MTQLYEGNEKKGRGGTANWQTDIVILFKHSHKSFSMATPEQDRWMYHSKSKGTGK